jgi:hypothetical protein
LYSGERGTLKRGVVCLCAALVGALLTATSTQSAQAKAPRFLVTIAGTQHFEWTLEDASAGSCSYKGHGEQSETFGTARPVKVIAPPARIRADRYKEFQAFNGRGWGRVVPLRGMETRVYRVLKAPTGQCEGMTPELRRDCRGTNPLVPRAGVALIRDRGKVALHVPVDTPWIERRPSDCDIRLFDLRNFFLSAVFGVRIYKPVQGGTFDNRRTKTLRVAYSVRYCVDPSESSDFEIALDTTCGPPRQGQRGPVLTGELTASWTVVFRRTR